MGTRRTLLVAVAVLVADQVTKALVRPSLVPVYRNDPASTLTHVARGSWELSLILATLLGAVIVAAVLLRLPRWAVGLVIGGVLGNALGPVTNFIPIGDYAMVNLADIAILAGAAGSVLWIFVQIAAGRPILAQIPDAPFPKRSIPLASPHEFRPEEAHH